MKLNRYKIDIEMEIKRIPTYKELAKLSGISESNMSHIMSRKVCKPITAGKIAEALGVPVEKIVMEEIESKMTFEQKMTILMALKDYRKQILQAMVHCEPYVDYFYNELSQVDDAEKVVKALEVEDAERK